jgi:hypothetical protein
MISELKREVVQTCGFDIEHRGHCELLSDLILEATDEFVSYNTLRRIWGLAKGGKPQRKTLDALSKYCGYRDLVEFNQAAPKLAFLQRQAEVHRLLSGTNVDALLALLKSQENRLEHMQLLLDVTRHVLLTERSSWLTALLESGVYQPTRYPYAYQIHFASSIGHVLSKLPKLPPNSLLCHPDFVEAVYLRLVDYSALNGYFGHWTECLLHQPMNREGQVFLHCLQHLRHVLNHDDPPELDLNQLVVPNCPTVLAGRIFSIHFLSSPETNLDHVLEDLERSLGMELPGDFLFFHEPLMVALMTPSQVLADWITKRVRIDVARLESFQLHDLHTYRLVQTQKFLFEGNRSKAKSWFDLVDPKEFLQPSGHDILVFPYRRIQAELTGTANRYPNDVRRVAERLGHARFSEKTWFTWFATEPQ